VSVPKMRGRMAALLFLLPSCVLLTACATKEPTTLIKAQVSQIAVPEPLLSCDPEPAPPPKDRETSPDFDREVGAYIALLRDWGADCAGNLAQIKKLQPETP